MKITAATILIIALATAAEATTVRVGPAERCTTIAAGIAAAQAGDTVRVAGGLYNEHGLVISLPIVLLGNNYPVIDGHNGGDLIDITAPGVSPDIATGRKCSVRPCVALSIRTLRLAPTSAASRRCNAASPTARNRFARALMSPPATCGIRAAGVPGRGE